MKKTTRGGVDWRDSRVNEKAKHREKRKVSVWDYYKSGGVGEGESIQGRKKGPTSKATGFSLVTALGNFGCWRKGKQGGIEDKREAQLLGKDLKTKSESQGGRGHPGQQGLHGGGSKPTSIPKKRETCLLKDATESNKSDQSKNGKDLRGRTKDFGLSLRWKRFWRQGLKKGKPEPPKKAR